MEAYLLASSVEFSVTGYLLLKNGHKIEESIVYLLGSEDPLYSPDSQQVCIRRHHMISILKHISEPMLYMDSYAVG